MFGCLDDILRHFHILHIGRIGHRLPAEQVEKCSEMRSTALRVSNTWLFSRAHLHRDIPNVNEKRFCRWERERQIGSKVLGHWLNQIRKTRKKETKSEEGGGLLRKRVPILAQLKAAAAENSATTTTTTAIGPPTENNKVPNNFTSVSGNFREKIDNDSIIDY